MSFRKSTLENIIIDNNTLHKIMEIQNIELEHKYIKQYFPCPYRIMEKLMIIQSFRRGPQVLDRLWPNNHIAPIISFYFNNKLVTSGEILGYRNSLKFIKEHYKSLELCPDTILRIHRILNDYFNAPNQKKGCWRTVDNTIAGHQRENKLDIVWHCVPPTHIEEYIVNLCSCYNDYSMKGNMEELILIVAFIFDFMHIHPFIDGNGRMARLLLRLLLYKNGFENTEHLNFDSYIYKTRYNYVKALISSHKGWYQGKHDLGTWLSYFLDLLLNLYKSFDKNIEMLKNHTEKTDEIISKLDDVIKYLEKNDTFLKLISISGE
jgi:Fic family protein